LPYDEIQRIAEQSTVKFWVKKRDGHRNGSGFVVSATHNVSWVMTNRHIVQGAIVEESHLYYAATGEQANFRILDCLPDGADLAIVETRLRFLQIPRISWLRKLTPGEHVHMFGYPHGEPGYVTGRHSHRSDDRRDPHLRDVDSNYMDVCNLVAPGGYSGSAVFDVCGDIVGVLSKSEEPGFAPSYVVPIGYVRILLRENNLTFLRHGRSDIEEVFSGGRVSLQSFDRPQVDNEQRVRGSKRRLRRREPVRSDDEVYPEPYERRRRPQRRRNRREPVYEVQLCCAVM
jgi:hypothetical protein